jgi:phosphoribosylanthranilate isomerase
MRKQITVDEIKEEIRFQIKALEANVNLELPQTVYARLLEWIELDNAHDKLLAAVKMVFDAADEASSQELGQNIDWDMLRDAYNLGLKGEA